MKFKSMIITMILSASFSLKAESTKFKDFANTNYLIGNPNFNLAIKKFFGSIKFLQNDSEELLHEHVLANLGGPPDEIIRINHNNYLASACRAHSCNDKAAVIFDENSTIIAIGLIYYNCNNGECLDDPKLAIFRISTKNTTNAVRALKEWARKLIGDIKYLDYIIFAK